MAHERSHGRHADTIIIGAGMAGLACASKLLSHPSYATGRKKLLVLEARDRIGGRIGSVRVNGNRLDTGANWIHGVGTNDEPNPLVQILPDKKYKELSGSVCFRPPPQEQRRSLPHGEAGTKQILETAADHDWVQIDTSDHSSRADRSPESLVVPPKFSRILFGAIWGLIGSLHERSTTTPAEIAKNTSLLQVIQADDDFREAFKLLSNEHHALLRALPQFVENMEAGPLVSLSSRTPSQNNVLGLLEFAIDEFEGAQVFLRDGYTAVVDEVAKDLLNEDRVKFVTEVKHIGWDTELITVSTTDSEFSATRVVCTLPLGVLKEKVTKAHLNQKNSDFFSPLLPRDKTEAIHSIGFGTLDKIFLIFSKPWWLEEPWSTTLRKGMTKMHVSDGDNHTTDAQDEPIEPDSLWGVTSELPGIEVYPDGHISPGLRSLSVLNLHALTGYPVLSCFVSCANATYVESLTDTAAGALIHRALTSWLGKEPPTSDAVYVTRWAQDEYSRGSYSHMITGLSETRHRECFQEPVVTPHGTELRFAGEHTSRNHFATVHGALISGWREADAILKSEEVPG